MPDQNGMVRVKDFEFSQEPKSFRLYAGDEFVFQAMPVIPIGILASLRDLRKLNVAESDEAAEKVLQFFDAVLMPESAAELRKRATQPGRFPFGINHMQPLIEWLMEEYGMRPTQPSSPSSTGSMTDATSTSSMAGLPAEERIHGVSLPTDS